MQKVVEHFQFNGSAGLPLSPMEEILPPKNVLHNECNEVEIFENLPS